MHVAMKRTNETYQLKTCDGNFSDADRRYSALGVVVGATCVVARLEMASRTG